MRLSRDSDFFYLVKLIYEKSWYLPLAGVSLGKLPKSQFAYLDNISVYLLVLKSTYVA